MNKFVLLLLICVFFITPLAGNLTFANDESNLLHSQSFENGLEEWTYGGNDASLYTKFSKECASDGEVSFYIHDVGDEYNIGLYSPEFEITSGEIYTASFDSYVLSGDLRGYLRFLDDEKLIINTYGAAGAINQWDNIVISGTAPDNAMYCQLIVMGTGTGEGYGYIDNVKLYNGKVDKREITAQPPVNEEDMWGYVNFDKVEDDGIPTGKVIYTHCIDDGVEDWSVNKSYVKTYDGKQVIELIDESLTTSVYAITPKFPVSEYNRYTVAANMYVTSGTVTYYVRFYDENDVMLFNDASPVNNGTWNAQIRHIVAPEGAKKIEIAFATRSTQVGTGYVHNVTIYKGFVNVPETDYTISPPSQKDEQNSQIIAPVDNKLVYNEYNDLGDKLSDFSYAGFYAGKYELPDTKDLYVYKTLSPSNDDTFEDLPRIQAAIDEASDYALKNGEMVVVKLKAGKYRVAKFGINMKSGVLLSGEGQGPTGTIIYAHTPVQHTVIHVKGGAIKNIGAPSYITDSYVKAGSSSFNISDEDIDNYNVGDLITITHPSNEEWVKQMKMSGITNVYGYDTTWKDNSAVSVEERTITGINGTEITVDFPFFIPYDTTVVPTYITKIDDSNRITDVGIENLRIEACFNGLSDDENHADVGIKFTYAKNCFVRNVTGKHLTFSTISSMDKAKQITALNCSYIEPISKIEGMRRYSFFSGTSAQQILYTGCYSYGGRHDFSTSSTVTGPISYVDNVADASYTISETHGTWSTGVLFDNIYSIENNTKGYLGFCNRGYYGTRISQGWSAAGSVMWNCLAPSIVVHKPPMTYQNFSVGIFGNYEDDIAKNAKERNIRNGKILYRTSEIIEGTDENFITEEGTSIIGDAYQENVLTPVNPRSIYKAQLSQRVTGVISNARPNAPIIIQPKCDLFTNDGNCTVSGIAQKGATKVTIYIDDVAYETEVLSDYTFLETVSLADGTHKIYATQTIDGVEGNKTADRFISINVIKGNEDYLQSNYEREKTSLIINDTRVAINEVSSLVSNAPEKLEQPLNVYKGHVLQTDPSTNVSYKNHLNQDVPLEGLYKMIITRIPDEADCEVLECGIIVSKNSADFDIDSCLLRIRSKTKRTQSGAYGTIIYNLNPLLKYYIKSYAIYKDSNGNNQVVLSDVKEL